MPSTLQIQADTFSLDSIFQDFYTVPSFQREYVWQREHVETMLTDIQEEFDRQFTRGHDEAEYFLGSIVVCKSEDGNSYDLIDGQQRMTTLYLLMCAMRDHMIEHEDEVPRALESQISFSKPKRGGGEIHRYRVELQYEDGKDVLEEVGKAETPLDVEQILEENGLSNSVENLLEAYRAIRDFLVGNFKDSDDVSAFWSQLVYDVKLIRIVTPDLTQALQIFETINERGIGLNAMDLLKNLLFMKASRRDAEEIAEKWKQMIDEVQASEKPLRFLRYFVLSQYDVDPDDKITENDIYPWFRDNPDQHRIEDNALGFLNRLIKYSKVYLNFIEDQGPDGTPNTYLQNISLATTSSARQHFILLMAAKDLPQHLFDKLCSHLENTLYCYLITRQRTNVLERNIIRWAQRIRNVQTESDFEAFLEDNLLKDLRSRQRDFETSFLTLSLDDLPKYRVRYTLGKVIKYIEDAAGRTSPELPSIAPKRRRRNAPQIEHIMPVKPTEESLATFDNREEYDETVQMLGNLTLLERNINASISNGTYDQKRDGYSNSSFLINLTLVSQPRVGKNTQFNRGTTELRQFEEWGKSQIRERQEMLLELARNVWLHAI